MAISRVAQDARRASPPLQRWVTRLIVLSILMYGSMLLSFSSLQLQDPQDLHSISNMRARHELGQKGDDGAVRLLRTNTNDENFSSPTLIKAADASTAAWKRRAEGFLSEIRAEKASSVVQSDSSGIYMNEDLIVMRLFPAPDTAENELVSRIASSGAGAVSRPRDASSRSNDSEVVGSSAEDPLLEPSDVVTLKQADAELHARSVKLLSAGETRKRALRCIGWRNTGNASPDGPREPQKDLTCAEFVPNNASGYCEVEDTKSGERFRVMRKSSNILRNGAPFRCINAPAFARFRVQAHEAMKNSSDPNYPLPSISDPQLPLRDGIVMVVYPKLVSSAYATIRVLRENLGCSLPIEIWFRPDEMEQAPDALVPLEHLAQNSSGGQISFHEIIEPVAKRFVAKIYAIYNSFFDHVLFLDADNVPIRDPSFLFNSSEFLQTGAIFWPDFWHPASTMFGLHNKSLLWELLDMPFVDMFEQESGQLVVDRRSHAAPLELALFYATHEPNFLLHYKLAWGDKDLFRLAWLKLNATFYMIQTPPAMAGMVTKLSAFCGMTMVQHDPQGEILFLHRNKHKLTGLDSGSTGTNSSEARANMDSGSSEFEHNFGSTSIDEYPDPVIWTHLLSFDRNWSRQLYVVQAFTTSLNFTSKQKCFGRRSLPYSPQFHVQAIANQTFAGLETDLRHFAKQATQIRERNLFESS